MKTSKKEQLAITEAKELKSKRATMKAKRNENKKSVTTKSFNDRHNNFIPEFKQERNPDAVLYLQLKNAKKLSMIGKKVVTYKQWQEIKMKEVMKRV